MPVSGDKPIRIARRGTMGVTLFDTDGEHVVSVERLTEEESEENEENGASAE
jgi:hypothetical protein